MERTWFITGTSRGLGRVWAEAALRRGERVAATARDVRTLDDLVRRHGDRVLALELDVTDQAGGEAAVRKAAEHFGRIDVLVNNAGYGLLGCVEEVTEEQVRRQFETNVFGSMWLIRAVLPVMREQGGGRILQVSSQTGLFAVPTLGIYEATKFAIEGLCQALAAEVAGHGIAVTLIEPEGYATDWGGSSLELAPAMPEYAAVHQGINDLMATLEFGDPQATAEAIRVVVESDAPPLRLFLGRNPLGIVRAEYEQRLAVWEAWDDVSRAAFGR